VTVVIAETPRRRRVAFITLRKGKFSADAARNVCVQRVDIGPRRAEIKRNFVSALRTASYWPILSALPAKLLSRPIR